MSNKRKRPSEVPDADPRALRVYRLKITLRDTEPPIWRRLEVYAGMEMDSLATAIESLFGWSGEHLGEFDVKGRTIGDEGGWTVADRRQPPMEFDELRVLRNRGAGKKQRLQQVRSLMKTISAKIEAAQAAAEADAPEVPTLSDIVPRVRTKLNYTYDFGDNWEHLIEVEKIAPPEPGVAYPRCTGGARANPIEDCGGPWGLAELVEAAGNPRHERYADLEEWGLRKWDPAAFSIEQADRQIARAFRRRR